MKSLTHPELDALLTAAETVSELDYLMLLVTFNHGLRASETLELTRHNIVGDHLVVQRKKGSARTDQPLLPGEKEMILALVAQRGDSVLFSMHRSTFWRKVRRYGKQALINLAKCHPHTLKHTCGRLAYEGGMGIPELQKYLGHVNGKNTMVYLESTEEQAAAAFAAAAGR